MRRPNDKRAVKRDTAAQIANEQPADPPSTQTTIQNELLAAHRLFAQAVSKIPDTRDKAIALNYMDTAFLWINETLRKLNR